MAVYKNKKGNVQIPDFIFMPLLLCKALETLFMIIDFEEMDVKIFMEGNSIHCCFYFLQKIK